MQGSRGYQHTDAYPTADAAMIGKGVQHTRILSARCPEYAWGYSSSYSMYPAAGNNGYQYEYEILVEIPHTLYEYDTTSHKSDDTNKSTVLYTHGGSFCDMM